MAIDPSAALDKSRFLPLLCVLVWTPTALLSHFNMSYAKSEYIETVRSGESVIPSSVKRMLS